MQVNAVQIQSGQRLSFRPDAGRVSRRKYRNPSGIQSSAENYFKWQQDLTREQIAANAKTFFAKMAKQPAPEMATA